MTESSNAKSKRKIVTYLCDYEWVQEISIFPKIDFDDLDASKAFAKAGVLELFDTLKTRLQKSVDTKNTAFFIRLRAMNKSFPFNVRDDWDELSKENYYITQMYIHIFCSQKIEIKELIKSVYDPELFNLKFRTTTDEKIISYCSTLKDQEFYNLNKLTNQPVRNFYLINKAGLVKRDESLKLDIQSKNKVVTDKPEHKQKYVKWTNKNMTKSSAETVEDGWD